MNKNLLYEQNLTIHLDKRDGTEPCCSKLGVPSYQVEEVTYPDGRRSHLLQ